MRGCIACPSRSPTFEGTYRQGLLVPFSPFLTMNVPRVGVNGRDSKARVLPFQHGQPGLCISSPIAADTTHHFAKTKRGPMNTEIERPAAASRFGQDYAELSSHCTGVGVDALWWSPAARNSLGLSGRGRATCANPPWHPGNDGSCLDIHWEAAYCLANPICSGSGSGLPLRQVHLIESLAKRLPTKHFRVPRGVDCV